MLLADFEIRHAIDAGTITINPFYDYMLQPASVDLQLAEEIRFYKDSDEPLNPYDIPADVTVPVKLTHEEPYVLVPGAFILGETVQYVRLGDGHAARIEGKSTIGRMGPSAHITAGFVDPGFRGTLTLEIKNNNDRRAIYLFPGMLIAQLCFMKVQPVTRPYGGETIDSHYQDQSGARPPASLRRVSGGTHGY